MKVNKHYSIDGIAVNLLTETGGISIYKMGESLLIAHEDEVLLKITPSYTGPYFEYEIEEV